MHICAEIGGKIINEMLCLYGYLCLEAGWDAFIPILFIKENKYIEKQTKTKLFLYRWLSNSKFKKQLSVIEDDGGQNVNVTGTGMKFLPRIAGQPSFGT